MRVSASSSVRSSDPQRADPVDGLGDARRLGQIHLSQPVDRSNHLRGELLGDARGADEDDLDLSLGGRVADPVVEATPLQCVVELARAVGREDHDRRLVGDDRADLRDRDLEVRQQLEQERLELVVSAVDLVDQEHRPVAGADSVEQWSFEQELRPEELVDVGVVEAALRQCPDLQHLPGVVPLVQRLVGVDALVALQSDQPTAGHGGQHFGYLGLADPDLTLEQQRALQRQRDEQGGGEPTIGEVATPPQRTRSGRGPFPGTSTVTGWS